MQDKIEKFEFTQDYSIKNAIALAQLSKEIYNHSKKDIDIEKVFESRYGYENALFFSTCNEQGCTIVDLQFCLLKKEDEITIVFKGSQEKEDWVTNANIKREQFNTDGIEVHAGFMHSLELFLQTLKNSDKTLGEINVSEIYKELLKNDSKFKIVITGHSLGGAVATLLSAYLKRRENTICYTFGAPPVGWKKFYDAYKSINLYRVVNRLDPVPHVNRWSSKISTKIVPVASAWKSLEHVGELKLLESDEHEHHLAIQYISNLQKEKKRTLKRKKLFNINSLLLKYRWSAFLSLMVIITIVFGLIGFMKMDYSLIDSVYLSISQFTLSFSENKDLNIYLEISRFTALVFVSSAILRAVYFFSYSSFFQPWRLSKNKNHIIIFGFNGHVKELVQNINKEEKETKVVLVTSKELDVGALGLQATVVKEPEYLSVRFMRMLCLENAKHIVCLEMNDHVDITHANGVIEYLDDKADVQNVRLHIHLHSYTLADLFNHENFIALQGKMPCDIKVFNHDENAVKILFRNIVMEDETILKNQRTHWLLSGDWNQTLSFMRYIAQIAYYKDERLPCITLVCKDINASQKELKKLFPKIEKTIELYFVESSDADTHAIPVTHIGVLFEDDVKGLEEALLLNNIFKDRLIFLQQREVSIVNNPQIISFGSFHMLNTTEILFDEVLDKRAKNIHNYYRELYGMEPWEELSLFKKNSNRMQAEHINIKLRGIGWENGSDFTGYEEFLQKNKELVEKWARVEHLRWNAFHYVNGWDWAESRDDAKKLHNCLVPFDELSKKEREKDEPALLKIPVFIKD